VLEREQEGKAQVRLGLHMPDLGRRGCGCCAAWVSLGAGDNRCGSAWFELEVVRGLWILVQDGGGRWTSLLSLAVVSVDRDFAATEAWWRWDATWMVLSQFVKHGAAVAAV
jgi:hypothetical protein